MNYKGQCHENNKMWCALCAKISKSGFRVETERSLNCMVGNNLCTVYIEGSANLSKK